MIPQLLVVNETASTQDDAKRHALSGAPHGTGVRALRQHDGRGRRGRTWLLADGGLALSVVVRCDVPALWAPRVSLTAADVTREVLAEAGVSALVKWPNDILIPWAHGPHGPLGSLRKVGGLLVEAVELDRTLRCAVVGVGLNVEAPAGGFPADLSSTAGALREVGYGSNVEQLADAVHAAFSTLLVERLNDDAFAATLDRLRRHSATLGRAVTVDDGDRVFMGTAVDLADDGALVVETAAGVQVVRAADVWPMTTSASTTA